MKIIPDANTLKKQRSMLTHGAIGFSPWSSGLHYFGPRMRQNIMVGRCGREKLASWWPGTKEKQRQRERKSLRIRYSLQKHNPNDVFLPTGLHLEIASSQKLGVNAVTRLKISRFSQLSRPYLWISLYLRIKSSIHEFGECFILIPFNYLTGMCTPTLAIIGKKKGLALE